MFEANRALVNSIEGMTGKEKEFLYSALNMHGHACGGMPMGYVAGLAAMKALGMAGRERNMETIAVVFAGNGHAAGCLVDGVQFSTGCNFGKGIMRKEPKGKWQFMLVQKKTGKAVKVRIKNEILDKAFSAPFITEYRLKGVNPTDVPEDLAKPAFTRLFGLKPEDVVEIEGPFDVEVPKARPCFTRQTCSVCGATVAENYIHMEEGKPVCTDCTNYKS